MALGLLPLAPFVSKIVKGFRILEIHNYSVVANGGSTPRGGNGDEILTMEHKRGP